MKLSLKAQIIASAVIAVFLCISISSFATWKTNQNLKIYQKIAEDNFPNIGAILAMDREMVEMEAISNLLVGTKNTLEQYKDAEAKMAKTIQSFEENQKKYEALPFGPGEEEVWNRFKEKSWTPYREHALYILALSKTGKDEDFVKRDKFGDDVWNKDIENRDAEFAKVKAFQDNDVKSNAELAAAQAAELTWLIPTLLGFAAVFSAGFAYVLGTSISKRLVTVTSLIDHSSKEVATSSQEIASSSQSLSQASTEQAAALAETASALEEITSMIGKAAESATATESNSRESQNKATLGREAVEKMMHAIEDIKLSNDHVMEQINQSNQEMTAIVQVIQEIGTKTKVINEIVFQTKLLSFNASVEAARAGEHGKGFAVVAEEVGSLAQMSGNAAKEITDLLSGSIVKVEQVVSSTKTRVGSILQESRGKVEAGVDLAHECSDALNEIVTNVQTVTQLAQEISTASKEQSQGVGEINKAMSQLDAVTQQNSSASEQAARAAENLSSQAEQLKEAIDDLVAVVQGSQRPSPRPPQSEGGKTTLEA